MPHAKVPSDSHLSIRMLKEAAHILNATAREFGRKSSGLSIHPITATEVDRSECFFNLQLWDLQPRSCKLKVRGSCVWKLEDWSGLVKVYSVAM